MLKNMDLVALVIRFMADWLVIIMALICAGAIFRQPRRSQKKIIIDAAIVVIIGYATARLLSLFYQGYRPYVEFGEAPGAWAANNAGFPSEHAMFAMCLVLITWVVTRNKALTVLLLGFGFAVILGRVAAMVHTPIDVVVGGLCAGVAATVVYRERLFKTH